MREQTRKFASNSRDLMLRFHREVSEKFPQPKERLGYVDLFFAGALRRSYALTRAFFDLVLAENFTASAPLIRLQLDTYLRTAAVALVDDPQAFFKAAVTGTPLDRIKDASGERMRDTYLCKKLEPEQPWLRDLYRETSAFIHFSDKHALASLAGKTRETFSYRVSNIEEGVPDEAYDHSILMFVQVTTPLLKNLDICAEAARAVHDNSAAPDQSGSVPAGA